MIRSIAWSLLVAISLAIALPAFSPPPAYAADTTQAVTGLPPVPWAKVAQWALKNALTLLMLVEEIWRDMQGGGGAPPEQPPPPTSPARGPNPGLELAFALPGAVRGCA